MSQESHGASGPVTVDPSQLEHLIHALTKMKNGEQAEVSNITFQHPAMADLQKSINGVIKEYNSRMEEFHTSSMELALGLSESFEVLSQIRRGNLNARISPDVLSSSDELMASLGKSLNETIEDIQDQLDTIQRQQMAIIELSTPVLQLWDEVLAIPIIGVVDTRRSAEIMEKLLLEIERRQCKFVIIDITGVEVVDTRTADHFIKVIKAAELLGTRCILTGIRPAVAHTLVDIGVDLSSITTLSNLKQGLEACLAELHHD